MNTDNIYFIAPYRIEGIQNATIDEAYAYLSKCNIIAVDVETTPEWYFRKYPKAGLDPYISSVVSLQMGDEHKQFIIDTRYVPIGKLKYILKSRKIVKVGVNLKFDYKMILHRFGIEMENMYDLYLAHMILNKGIIVGKEDKSSSLKAMVKEFLDIDLETNQLSLFPTYPNKSTATSFLDIESRDFSFDQVTYAAADVLLPMALYKKILPLVRKEGVSKCVQEECKYLKVAAEMELSGFYLNTKKWVELANITKSELTDICLEMNQYLLDNGLENFIGMKWSSHKQVAELFDHLGYNVKIINEKLSTPEVPVYKYSVGKDVIAKLANVYKLAEMFEQFQILTKAVSTYGISFLKHINPISGRLHSDIFQIVNTGRVSSARPNLQNLPRDTRYRHCFTAPDDDKVIISADFSNQEARVLAELSQDKVLLDLFINGDGDMHSKTARALFPDFIDKKSSSDLRDKAKTVNFLIIYGGGAGKLAKQYNLPMSTTGGWITSFYDMYTGVKPYFDKLTEKVLSTGKITIDKYTNRIFNLSYFEEYKRLSEWEV